MQDLLRGRIKRTICMACFNFRVTFKCLDSFNAELDITGPCGSGKLSIINQECCCEHSCTSNCIRIFHKTRYLPIINWDVYSDGFGAFNKTAKPLKCSSLFYTTTNCGSSIYVKLWSKHFMSFSWLCPKGQDTHNSLEFGGWNIKSWKLLCEVASILTWTS